MRIKEKRLVLPPPNPVLPSHHTSLLTKDGFSDEVYRDSCLWCNIQQASCSGETEQMATSKKVSVIRKHHKIWRKGRGRGLDDGREGRRGGAGYALQGVAKMNLTTLYVIRTKKWCSHIVCADKASQARGFLLIGMQHPKIEEINQNRKKTKKKEIP